MTSSCTKIDMVTTMWRHLSTCSAMNLIDEKQFVSQYLHLLSLRAVRYSADHVQQPLQSTNRLKKTVKPPNVEQSTEMKLVEPVPSATPATASSASTTPITLTVKTLKPPVTYTIALDSSDTVHTLKDHLHQQTGIPLVQQRLVLKGKAMLDTHVLSDYGLTNGSTVHLMVTKAPETAPPQVPTSPAVPASIPPAVPASISPAVPASQSEAEQPSIIGLTPLGSAHLKGTGFWVNLRKLLGREFTDRGDAERVLGEFMSLYKEMLGKLTPEEVESIVVGAK